MRKGDGGSERRRIGIPRKMRMISHLPARIGPKFVRFKNATTSRTHDGSVDQRKPIVKPSSR